MGGWLRQHSGSMSLRSEHPDIMGAMGPSMSWDPWPRPVVRAAVETQECTQIGENGLSGPFWGICVHCCDARVARVATRAASSGTSASTTMVCRRRPLGGHLSLSRETRLCASGAVARLASSRNVNPQTLEKPENSLVPPNRTVRLAGEMSRA